MPGKGQYTRTKEEMLADLKARHGDRFVIDDFEYKGASTPIVAHCSDHGPFEILLADLIKSNRGCSSCPPDFSKTYKRTRQEYIEEIQAKYGDKLIVEDDVESEYLGAKTVVTARCSEHGLFTGSLGKILDGSNKCPGCRITTRGRYKRTKQEYLDLIREKHGDKFTIFPFEYKGGETMIQVECPEHGLFEKKIDKMVQDKHGCPQCSLSLRGKLVSKKLKGIKHPNRKPPKPGAFASITFSVEDAQKRIVLPEHITADWTEYETFGRGRVKTYCTEHGESVWPSAASLAQSPRRCKGCIAQYTIKRKPGTFSAFVKRANEKFASRFTYLDDYEFVNLRSYVSVICPDHGPQKIRAGKHVIHGQYCSECRLNDMRVKGLLPGLYAEAIPFDPELQSMPGRLYYYQHGSKLKIGITKNTMNKRLKGHPARHKITRVESVEMTMGEAVAIEQYTLKRFAKFRIARDWSTELFDRDVLANAGYDSLESYVDWFRRNESVDAELQRLRENMESRGFSHIKEE